MIEITLYSATGDVVTRARPVGFIWSLPKAPIKHETPPADTGCASAVGYMEVGDIYESGYQG